MGTLSSLKEQIECATVAAPEFFVARSPFWLALGPERASAERSHEDTETMESLFFSCPVRQWFCAAQAAQSKAIFEAAK